MSKDIYQALNEVMKDVGYVQKTKGGNLQYKYVGEVALIKAIRPHFVEHGIVVHPHEVKELHQDAYTTRSGAIMNRTTVVTSCRFAHAPSGTFIDVGVTGEGADVGDKSANKALTGAYKYALRQALMIETGDDPDQFKSEPRSEAVKDPQQPPDEKVPSPSDNTQGPETQEPVKAENSTVKKLMAAVKFVGYTTDRLHFKSDQHTRATMGLLGFKAVPNDGDARKRMYDALEAYRHLRDDKQLSQDDALTALADVEAE